MRPRRQRLFSERQKNILNKNTSPRMNKGIVGRNCRRNNHSCKKPHYPDRQNRSERRRHTHLLPQLLVSKLIERSLNRRRLIREFWQIQIGENENRDQRHDKQRYHAAKFPENFCHFRFVRTFCRRIVTLRSLPGEIAVDLDKRHHRKEPDVEFRNVFLIKRIDPRFSLRRIVQTFHQVSPRKMAEKNRQNHKQHKRNELALNKIGDHDGDLSAGECHEKRNRKQNRHDRRKSRQLESKKIKARRQSTKINQETRRYRRKNSVIQDPR